MSDFDHVTNDAVIETYGPARSVFTVLLREVRELSKKKPEATLSASKVKLVNDLLTFLSSEPEGRYLDALKDDDLPQVSDALLMMVQFDAALDAFKARYYKRISSELYAEKFWITEELVAELQEEESSDDAEYVEDDHD